MFFTFIYLCVCTEVRVEVGEQLAEVSSLLVPCGFQGSDSGCQAEKEALYSVDHLLIQKIPTALF